MNTIAVKCKKSLDNNSANAEYTTNLENTGLLDDRSDWS